MLLALHRLCAARAQVAVHQGAAFGWNGCCLWKTCSLAFCISLERPTAAMSISSVVGVEGMERGVARALSALIHSSLRSGLMTKPRLAAGALWGLVEQVVPFTWRRAWSDPMQPSQSILRPEKVPCCTAAALYQARSMTESCSCSTPLGDLLWVVCE